MEKVQAQILKSQMENTKSTGALILNSQMENTEKAQAQILTLARLLRGQTHYAH